MAIHEVNQWYRVTLIKNQIIPLTRYPLPMFNFTRPKYTRYAPRKGLASGSTWILVLAGKAYGRAQTCSSLPESQVVIYLEVERSFYIEDQQPKEVRESQKWRSNLLARSYSLIYGPDLLFLFHSS
jgi:hypothetical protein